MRIVGLGGGIGASRLWTALARRLGPDELTLVVNTADDLWHYGLRVCPDLDTTLYALSGRQDTDRGWGVRGETWRSMQALADLGEEVWFNLGDVDLATHLARTGWLRDGLGLTAVTARLSRAMDVTATVLPMTEDEVQTVVELDTGEMVHYEHFLVRLGAAVPLRSVRHEGASSATPAPGVLDAIAGADVVVLAPSSPIASIAPILAVPGVRAALRARRDRAVAVSPIVAGVPIEDAGERRRATARAALLTASSVPATPTGAATLYSGLIRRFVLDEADRDQATAVAALGVEPVTAPTLLHRGADPEPLLAALRG